MVYHSQSLECLNNCCHTAAAAAAGNHHPAAFVPPPSDPRPPDPPPSEQPPPVAALHSKHWLGPRRQLVAADPLHTDLELRAPLDCDRTAHCARLLAVAHVP